MHRDSLPGKKRYRGLAGSSDALVLSRLAAESRPLAVMSASALDAARLLEEIAWFAPGLRSCLLPDWETLPYDSFSPHHDLVSERLATLYRIQRGEFDVVTRSFIFWDGAQPSRHLRVAFDRDAVTRLTDAEGGERPEARPATMFGHSVLVLF